MAIADEIAQLTHDIEDGIRGGIISFDAFCTCDLVKEYVLLLDDTFLKPNLSYNKKNQIIKGLVGYLISDVVQNSKVEIQHYNEENDIPDFSSKHSVYERSASVFLTK